MLVFIGYNWCDRLVYRKIIVYWWLDHKPDSAAQLISFWLQKWIICVFCGNSFTGFFWVGIFLLNLLHVKTLGCLVTALMFSDVFALLCIIYIFEGILECLFIYNSIYLIGPFSAGSFLMPTVLKMRLTTIRAGVKRATNFSRSGVKRAAIFGRPM